MSGFRVQAPPPPPPVIAPPGADRCREKCHEHAGVFCERPEGHDGGHLSESRNRYWQAAS